MTPIAMSPAQLDAAISDKAWVYVCTGADVIKCKPRKGKAFTNASNIGGSAGFMRKDGDSWVKLAPGDCYATAQEAWAATAECAHMGVFFAMQMFNRAKAEADRLEAELKRWAQAFERASKLSGGAA